jgi:beta-glucosidase
MPRPTDEEFEDLLAAHRRACEIVRRDAKARAGWTVSVTDLQVLPGGEEKAADWFEAFEGRFLRAAAGDDFIGVQNYFRTRFDSSGLLMPPSNARMTDLWEFYPDALGPAVATAYQVTGGVPVLVTENGIPTSNDELRMEFTEKALQSLASAMAGGVEVLGYLHWSAFDNYEWPLGFGPKFGLIEVDRKTLERRVKPSGQHYANLIASARRSPGV